MDRAEALHFIRQTLALEAVWYFEVYLKSAADVAFVAESLIEDACSVEAFPADLLIKVRRPLLSETEPYSARRHEGVKGEE